MYNGLIEHNGTEGESWGYYFEVTPEVDELFDQLQVQVDKWNDEGYDEQFDIERNMTGRDLDVLSKGTRNGYMGRVHICDSEKSLEALRTIHMAQIPPYKASFPIESRMTEWGEDYNNWFDLRG